MHLPVGSVVHHIGSTEEGRIVRVIRSGTAVGYVVVITSPVSGTEVEALWSARTIQEVIERAKRLAQRARESAAGRSRYERHLAFAAGPSWFGWFCERCCWHVESKSLPIQEEPLMEIQQQFERHVCEQYARENWGSGVP
jgi:hypothetical protein